MVLLKRLLFTLFFINVISFSAFAKDLKGNSSGNLNYDGLIIQNQDWIYYSNQDDGGKLYKISKDLNRKYKINNYQSKYINISREWIYFIEQGTSICKMKTNGTSKKKLIEASDINWMQVINDKIYYSESYTESGDYPGLDSNYINYAKLIQTDLNGSNKKNINDSQRGGMGMQHRFSFININDGWIYYSNQEDYLGIAYSKYDYTLGSEKIYKIRVNGKDKKELFSDYVSDINVVGDWIYFVNASQQKTLYKLSLNGKKKVKILNDSVAGVSIYDGWIYYINLSDNKNIYKVKLDGTKKTKIKNVNPGERFNVSGDYIYSSNAFYVNTLNKIDIQGNNQKKIVSDQVQEISNIDNNYIIYINKSNESLYRVKKDGTKKIQLGNDKVQEVCKTVYGEIFYINQLDKCVYKIKLDGSVRTKITSNKDEIQVLDIINGNLYYMPIYLNVDNYVYKVDLDGKHKQKIIQGLYQHEIKYYDGCFYYENSKGKLIRVNLDGTKKQTIADYGYIIGIKDGWIYKSDGKSPVYPSKGLYKIKVDGSSSVKIMDDFYQAIIVGNSIFYTITQDSEDSNYGIYKIDFNGTNKVKFANVNPSLENIKLYNGKMFFNVWGDGAIYSVNLDGNYLKILNKQDVSDFIIKDDKIYYCTDIELYCMNIDGSNKVKLLDGLGQMQGSYFIRIGEDEVILDKNNIYYVYRGLDRDENYKEKYKFYKK